MPDNHFQHQLVGSPCCLPKWSYEQLVPTYRDLGFSKFEAFSEWAQARLYWREDPAIAGQKALDAGIAITSFHLPVIDVSDIEAGLDNAIAAARYAQAVGAKVMLFKATTREVFGQIGIRFLDALDREQITVTPVVQNHRGTAISTLEDYQEVFNRLDNDPRLKQSSKLGIFIVSGFHGKPVGTFSPTALL